MEQAANQTTWILIAFNVLLAITSFFGAHWMRRMEGDMERMQETHANFVRKSAERELALQEKLNGYVAKEDFREFRTEMLQNFQGVFNRMDQLADRLHVPSGKG